MHLGSYKNPLGAILHITGSFVGTNRVRTLGGIYEAEARDPLFGTTVYLVTKESMDSAGYVLMEEPDSE